MKLFLITSKAELGYDSYDAAVVAAESLESAKILHPGGRLPSEGDGYDWPTDIGLIDVKEIGEAVPGTEPGVILASFNAG